MVWKNEGREELQKKEKDCVNHLKNTSKTSVDVSSEGPSSGS